MDIKNILLVVKDKDTILKTNFSWGAMTELVGNILKHNIPEFPKEVELSLPTLETPKL